MPKSFKWKWWSFVTPLPTRFTWFRNGVFVACNCVFTSSNTDYHVFSHLLLHLSSFKLFDRYREKKRGSQNLLSSSLFVFWFYFSGFFFHSVSIVMIICVLGNKSAVEIFSVLSFNRVDYCLEEHGSSIRHTHKRFEKLELKNSMVETLYAPHRTQYTEALEIRKESLEKRKEIPVRYIS